MGLSGIMVHLNPSQAAKHSFPLFSQNALRTLRTHVRTYARKKNQTSKVSLCGKRTGSKNSYNMLNSNYSNSRILDIEGHSNIHIATKKFCSVVAPA